MAFPLEDSVLALQRKWRATRQNLSSCVYGDGKGHGAFPMVSCKDLNAALDVLIIIDIKLKTYVLMRRSKIIAAAPQRG